MSQISEGLNCLGKAPLSLHELEREPQPKRLVGKGTDAKHYETGQCCARVALGLVAASMAFGVAHEMQSVPPIPVQSWEESPEVGAGLQGARHARPGAAPGSALLIRDPWALQSLE